MRILLALPTLIYAPIYVAKSKGINSAFRNVTIDYSDSPDFDRPNSYDPLVQDLLSRKKNDTILAVGDPVRLLARPRRDTWQIPFIERGLVRKACYWAIDGDVLFEHGLDQFFKLVVHPRGMTGYAITFYLLSRTPGIELHEAAERLFDDIVPGEEKQWYNLFCKKDRALNFGYVTTDPSEEFFAETNGYTSMCYMKNNIINDFLMTALITTEEVKDDQKKNHFLMQLYEGISAAISLMINQPQEAAFYLYNYSDENISFKSHWTYESLANILTGLVRSNVYNEDLLVTNRQVENSIQLWAPLEEHLMKTNTKGFLLSRLPQFIHFSH